MVVNSAFGDMLNNFVIFARAQNQSKFLTSFTLTFMDLFAMYYIKRFRKMLILDSNLIVEKFVENERITIDVQKY